MVNGTTEKHVEPENKKPKWESNNDINDDSETTTETIVKHSGQTPPNPLSKNHLKKLKKLANYDRIKKERRLRERERMKEKRQEAAEKGLPIRTGPSRKELKRKQQLISENALRVVIDLDFDDLMHDRDVAKCVKQCLRIYTVNRRAERSSRLYFTGIKPEGRVHSAFKKNDGYENWNVEYHFGTSYMNLFDKDEIIYLTSDSDVVLGNLQSDKVYIIGGLVDHNHQKGLCHERAVKQGVKTARLPLNENVDMKTRTVLTTFHVFELLMRVSEGKSWTDAILETIPLRKGAKPKNQETGDVTATAIDCNHLVENNQHTEISCLSSAKPVLTTEESKNS